VLGRFYDVLSTLIAEDELTFSSLEFQELVAEFSTIIDTIVNTVVDDDGNSGNGTTVRYTSVLISLMLYLMIIVLLRTSTIKVSRVMNFSLRIPRVLLCTRMSLAFVFHDDIYDRCLPCLHA